MNAFHPDHNGGEAGYVFGANKWAVGMYKDSAYCGFDRKSRKKQIKEVVTEESTLAIYWSAVLVHPYLPVQIVTHEHFKLHAHSQGISSYCIFPKLRGFLIMVLCILSS